MLAPGILLLMFTCVPAAQQGTGVQLRPATGTPRAVHLDHATGILTRGTPASDRAGTLVRDFGRVSLLVQAGATGNGQTEFISAGLKGTAGNASNLVTRASVPYWSSKLDPSLGGPGGTIRLGFYEGYTLGGGAPTTTVAVFTLTGLPGNTASTTFQSGAFAYYILSLDFAPLPFSDGAIGYSWRFLDHDLAGVEAGTGPFLTCASSCSYSGWDPYGNLGPLDVYSPPGTLAPPLSQQLTVTMELYEIADFTATLAPLAGDGVNQDVLTATPAILGQPWSVTLAIPGGAHHHGPGGPFVLRVRTTAINGPTFNSPLGGRPTEALIAGPLLAQFVTTQNGLTGSVGPLPIPLSIAIVDTPWAAQATVIGGGFGDLSLGVAGRVGTQ